MGDAVNYLLAYAVTALFAAGGYLIYGAGRYWSTVRRRRHELRIARLAAEAELRQAELRAHAQEIELANEIYQDFKRRHPHSP